VTVAAAPHTLDDVVERTMREHPVPGVAVGLIAHGEETVQGFGVTNVDHPLDPDTLFQIGSITKTVPRQPSCRASSGGASRSLHRWARTRSPDRLSSDTRPRVQR
jgi:hypothetical protein